MDEPFERGPRRPLDATCRPARRAGLARRDRSTSARAAAAPLRFGRSPGEDRDRLACAVVRPHRLRQPAPRRDHVPDHRRRRDRPDPARHRTGLGLVGAAGRLPRGRRDRPPGGDPRDLRGDGPARRAGRDRRALHAARGGVVVPSRSRRGSSAATAAPTPEATEIVAFAPEAIPWSGIAFKTTIWALRDWLDRRRPDSTRRSSRASGGGLEPACRAAAEHRRRAATELGRSVTELRGTPAPRRRREAVCSDAPGSSGCPWRRRPKASRPSVRQCSPDACRRTVTGPRRAASDTDRRRHRSDGCMRHGRRSATSDGVRPTTTRRPAGRARRSGRAAGRRGHAPGRPTSTQSPERSPRLAMRPAIGRIGPGREHDERGRRRTRDRLPGRAGRQQRASDERPARPAAGRRPSAPLSVRSMKTFFVSV